MAISVGSRVLLTLGTAPDPVRSHPALVAGTITSGGTVADLIVLGDGNDWEDNGGDKSYTIRNYFAQAQGTAANQWQVIPDPIGGNITASSLRTYTAGTNVTPNTSRDTQVTASLSVTTTVSILAGSSGTFKLFSDSATTPTTEIVQCRVSNANSGVLGLVTTLTSSVTFTVRAGDSYRFTFTQDTGTATGSINGGQVLEQMIG